MYMYEVSIVGLSFSLTNAWTPILALRCMGTPPFVAIFAKGNNFCDCLSSSLDNKALPKHRLLIQERICS